MSDMQTRKAAPKRAVPAQKEPESPSRINLESPLVFISHDSRDADLAEAFGNLLTDASGGILKSFRSSDRKGTSGIAYGQEWYSAIMEKLEAATDVVALLTARSLNRPWILYEAGVAKGKLYANQSVLGLALGVSLDEAATGPFAQFQNSPDEEDAITSLVLQLIRRNPQADPREEAVRRQVKAFREAVATLLAGRSSEPTDDPSKTEENSVAKLFEEMKVLVRSVPDRVLSELEPQRLRGIRRRKFHPAFLHETLFMNSRESAEPEIALSILIMSSMFRDDVPWLYEIGLQLFRAIESKNQRAIDRARDYLRQTLQFVRKNAMMREFAGGLELEEGLHMFMELDHVLELFWGERSKASKAQVEESKG